jgi:hypothetical protein
LKKRQYGTPAMMPGEQLRKDLVQVPLDDVVVGLQRVDVGAEGQACDGIDGEAHQVGLQVDRCAGVAALASARPGARRTSPATGSRP